MTTMDPWENGTGLLPSQRAVVLLSRGMAVEEVAARTGLTVPAVASTGRSYLGWPGELKSIRMAADEILRARDAGMLPAVEQDAAAEDAAQTLRLVEDLMPPAPAAAWRRRTHEVLDVQLPAGLRVSVELTEGLVVLGETVAGWPRSWRAMDPDTARVLGMRLVEAATLAVPPRPVEIEAAKRYPDPEPELGR